MHLKNRIDVGEFAVLVALVPPKGIDLSGMLSVADKLKGKVAAVMRTSALGYFMILQRRGLETVMQVCCRDRNRHGQKDHGSTQGARGFPGVVIERMGWKEKLPELVE